MNPSGGLRWHWRAWRQGPAWAPTCATIADWLHSCQAQSRHLILLGPSAGWMLPAPWLLGFESILALDIDPWARRLFAHRHGRRLSAAGVRWQYQTQDALANLPDLLQAHPNACVLFDNLLGQLRFHAGTGQAKAEPDALETRMQTVRAQLAGREWGSVHDLISGPVDFAGMMQPAALDGRAGEDAAQWTPPLLPAGARGPWLDHLTGQLLPSGTPVKRMAWAFSPRYWHVLEAGWVRPSAQV